MTCICFTVPEMPFENDIFQISRKTSLFINKG